MKTPGAMVIEESIDLLESMDGSAIALHVHELQESAILQPKPKALEELSKDFTDFELGYLVGVSTMRAFIAQNPSGASGL